MPFISIKKLLHQKIGLNASSIGDSSIERAIRHRLSLNSISDVKQYYELLLKNADELSDLVEEIVVPETWFFRNNSPFEALSEYVVTTIQPKLTEDQPIRILSLPCSSGEEPYSIAIGLDRVGVPMAKVKIDAIDISKRALTKARRGIYGKNSFRGDDAAMKSRYFEKGGAGYRISDKIREAVTFRQANFLNATLSPEPAYYDVIFCRNLMIYFDRETQQLALDKLSRALKERGVLFVGHAEASQVNRNHFVQLYSAKTFGYVKVDESNARKSVRAAKSPVKVPDQWLSVFDQLSKINPEKIEAGKANKLAVKNKYLDQTKTIQNKPSEALTPKISLISVERLANQGKYEEAINLCKGYLKQQPESAEAYYLMGLVMDLNGCPEDADKLLRKSIYLNPNHEQALLLASLLAEKRGDIEVALSYKRRAKRVSDRNPGNSSVA
ncbi:CheR family methyltransferase [Kaarinaea lacus]